MSSDLHDQLQNSLGKSYRLSRELGGGGMSKVFIADDAARGHRVVVKVLPPDLAAGVNLERFQREIQLAGTLHHPRIVPVLDAGHTGEIIYYTMPFIDGESLRALIGREVQLPLERALGITRDVAEALRHAHEHNIVHRDIKPDNILVDRISGRAVVTDFGIARAIENAADILSVTSTGLTLGTPTYMSPEQAAADPHLDGRSDLYSLGCVLHEMLAGQPPFTGPTARAIIARHMTEPPPSIRTIRPELPLSAEQTLTAMLAKAPESRFASARVLLDALEHPESMVVPRARAGGLRHHLFVLALVVLIAAAIAAVLILRR